MVRYFACVIEMPIRKFWKAKSKTHHFQTHPLSNVIEMLLIY